MLDPHSVLKLLGIDAGWTYPIAADCPLCRGRGKLEIRTAVQVHCRSCHFIGDLIELLASKRGETLENTVDELILLSLVDFDTSRRFGYLAEKKADRARINLLMERSAAAKQGFPGSVNAILDMLNIRMGPAVLQRLAPHICSLRADDIAEAGLELPKSAKATMQWWGRYTALAVPCWDLIDLVGFWLFTTCGAMYLPLVDYAAIGTGFGLVPSFTDDYAVVVDDPVAALRMTLWSVKCNNRPTAFVCPNGLRDRIDTFRCGRTVFWSPSGNVQHYVRALKQPDAGSLDHRVFDFDPLRDVPAAGNWSYLHKQVINALPAHQALARYLLDLTPEDARPVLSCGIDPGDRARIISYATGEDAKHLDRLFGDCIRDESVSWNGDVITDTSSGWVVKGKVISDVKLHLERLRPIGDKGDAEITGTLLYQDPSGERMSVRFKDMLSDMRKDTGEWMQRKILASCGRYPFVERRWSKKLFEVAQQFHVPAPTLSDQAYGWFDSKLRMPNFSVDANNLYATRGLLEGPGIKIPSHLSPNEWNEFKSPAFCRVVLAFLGNLIRTANGRKGVGIMLTNEEHVVTRLAQAFGASIRVNPSTIEVDERGNEPIPVFTEWNTKSLSRLMRELSGYKNIVLSVDKRTSQLTRLCPDWLQLSVGEGIDYSALRVVFLLLPTLLRSRVNVDDDMFYRTIHDVLSSEVSYKCKGHRVKEAAIALDTHNMYRGSTAATRILEMIFYGIASGDITPGYSEVAVSVSKSQFRSFLANPVVPVPSESEITSRLTDARFLLSDDEEVWCFDRTTWELNQSLSDCTYT